MKLRHWGRSGFSNSEILASIAGGFVLAVVASGPLSRAVEASALSGAAREIFAQTRGARMTAVTTRVPQRIAVTAGELRVETWDGELRQWGAARIPWHTQRLNHIVHASAPIVFWPDGTAKPGGEITVRDGEGNVRTVRVSHSGRSRID